MSHLLPARATVEWAQSPTKGEIPLTAPSRAGLGLDNWREMNRKSRRTFLLGRWYEICSTLTTQTGRRFWPEEARDDNLN